MTRALQEKIGIWATLMVAVVGCATKPPTANFAIKDVNVVEVDSGTIAEGQMILIAEGRIKAVLNDGPVNADQIIDGNGRYAIPGLFDTHVHTIGSNSDRMMVDQGLFIAHGVTHVREMGAGFETFKAALTTFASQADKPQPRRIAAGPLLDNVSYQWYNQTVISDSKQAAVMLPELAAAGVDFFKAYSGLSPDAYQGILDEAKRLGIPVDGHVPNAVGLAAVAAGSQRTIEHLNYDTFLSCTAKGQEWASIVGPTRFSPRGWEAYYEASTDFWQDIEWDGCLDPAFGTFADRGGVFVPTLMMEVMTPSRLDVEDTELLASNDWCQQNLTSIKAADPRIRETFEAALKDAFLRLRKSGVVLLAGTDSQNFCLTPGVSLAWEMQTMAEFGLSNAEVLKAATLTPAEVFGFRPEVGLLAPEHEAHVVLLDDNPLDSLATLRRPTGVYTQERWFNAGELEALREAARVALEN